MRKEIFLAILAGGAFGLLIAFAVWKLNFSIKKNTVNASPTPKTVAMGTNQPIIAAGEFKIILNSPTSLSVFSAPSTEITGVTNPGSFVLISGEDGDEIVTASENGSFSGKVDLTPGANQIGVTSLDTSGNIAQVTVVVIYSGQFQQPASGNGTSYIGTVTDITDSIIQLKNDDGDIEQVKPSEAASFVNNSNNETKPIKESDVAIGDFLIAMGTRGQNNIMDATRLLVTDQLGAFSRKTVIGTVTDSNTIGQIIVKTLQGETFTVTPADDLTIDGVNRFSLINDNDKVILSGELSEGSIDARIIKILK